MSTTLQDEPVTGEIVDDHAPAPEPTSTAVVRRERRSEVIRPLDADQLIESFGAYQELLPRLLDDSDYQDAGRGKRFVKKSGWRKIATAFDLDVQIIRSTIERDEGGGPLRAEVWARAIAPSGRSMDGDGYCSVDEERFSGPRGNKSKLENDLRATATTRAMNRAISGLVGMGETSAEEMSGGGHHDPLPEWAQPATDDRKRLAVDCLQFILGNQPEHRALAKAALAAAAERLGSCPDALAAALSAIAKTMQDARTTPPAQPAQPVAYGEPPAAVPEGQPEGEVLTGEQVIEAERGFRIDELVRERGLTVRQTMGLLVTAGVEQVAPTKPGVETAILALTPRQADDVEQQLRNIPPIPKPEEA